MKIIKLANDHALQKQLKAELEKKEEKEVKQYDNHPAAGTKEPEPVEQEQQADTQEPAKEEAPKEKKVRGKKSQE